MPSVPSQADKPTFDPGWQPDDWQVSLSTRFLFTDNMAGFYRDGFTVTDVKQNNYNKGDYSYSTYDVEADGFSTAFGGLPVGAEISFVRKNPLFAAGRQNGDTVLRPVVGGFESKGPSLTLGVSYQKNYFTHYGYGFTLSDRQLMMILDDTSEKAGAQFNEDFRDFGGGAAYAGEIEEWLNELFNNVGNIFDIFQEGFSQYDPSRDVQVYARNTTDDAVNTFKGDAKICLESSVWRYDRRVNFLHSGKGCLNGSAVYFGGNHFSDNLYLGIGPYFEFTLASLHQKPFHKPAFYGLNSAREFVPPSLTVSTFVYADAQYFNGFNIGDGDGQAFDDRNRFVTGNIGAGVRTTIPSFSRRKISPERPVREKPVPEMPARERPILDELYDDPPEMDLDEMPLGAM